MRLRRSLLRVGLPLGLVALGLAVPDVNAQTNSWTNSATGYWQDATSWSLGLAPAPTQSLLITNAGNKTVLIDSSTSSGYSNTLTVSDLILAGQTGSTNTVFVNSIGSNPSVHILNSLIVNPGGALLTTNSALIVDNAAGGAVDIEGTAALSGTNIFSGVIDVGFSTNSTALVSIIDGQTAVTNGYMTIGFYGAAQVTVLGATFETEDDIIVTNGLLVGPGSAPNGLFVGLGPASQGSLTVLGGTLDVPEQFSLGEDAGSTGRFVLNGGQLVATNNYLISIGGSGVGQVVVSNGQVDACLLMVANALGSDGTFTLAGGTVNLSGAMVVAQGQSSTGSVVMTGGQLMATNQSVSIGGFGTGEMTVSNGSLIAQSVIIGNCENSQGTLTIAGGTVSITSNMTAGARAYTGTATNANASGTINITGGSLTVTNQSGTGLLTIGQLGKGLFVQEGGLVQLNQLTVGAMNLSNVFTLETNVYIVAGGVGQAVLSNGQLFAQTVSVGLGTNCQGSLTIDGGQMSVASNILAGVVPGAAGVIQIAGGDLYVTNQFGTARLVVGLAGLGAFAQNGGVVTVDQMLVTNGPYSVVVNNVTNILYSTFNLKSGTFNSRSTSINNGLSFAVGDGDDSATYHLLGGIHSFAYGIEVRSNAVLSGCGTINGSVLVDPGGLVLADCGGTLTFTGSVTNDGAVEAANGSTVESYGSVVNNGVLDIINGNTNFHAGFVNNGTVLTSNSVPQIISITAVGSNIQVQFTTATNLNYIFEYTGNLLAGSWTPLVGFSGPGGNVTVTDFNAILQTQRFYRVRLVVSP